MDPGIPQVPQNNVDGGNQGCREGTYYGLLTHPPFKYILQEGIGDDSFTKTLRNTLVKEEPASLKSVSVAILLG